jgi:hypothetical protein
LLFYQYSNTIFTRYLNEKIGYLFLPGLVYYGLCIRAGFQGRHSVCGGKKRHVKILHRIFRQQQGKLKLRRPGNSFAGQRQVCGNPKHSGFYIVWVDRLGKFIDEAGCCGDH